MTDFLPPTRLSPSLILLLSLTLAAGTAAQETSATAITPVHLTLPAAVDLALAHNRKVTLTRLSVQDNQEQKRIAESHYFPDIANKSDVKHITELEGIVIPAGALSHGTSAGAIPSQTLRIDQGGSTSYISATALNQPITQLLRIHEGVKAADADLKIAKTQASDTEDAIALQVHELYYNLLIEQMRASVAEDAVTAASVAEQENLKGVQQGRLLNSVELASRAELLEKQRAVLVSRLNADDLALQLDTPRAKIIVLTTYSGDVQAHRALTAGAAGYLLKHMLRTDLLGTIRTVHAGGRSISPQIAIGLAEHIGTEPLSEREIEVLRSVSAGHTNKAVAEELLISEETVKGHIKSILLKLGANDRTHAVMLAISRGFLERDE